MLVTAFSADHARVLSTVTVNGYVGCDDPATGRRSRVFLATVTADRQGISRLDLSRADPVSCLEAGLQGQLSPRPEKLTPVHPVQAASSLPNCWNAMASAISQSDSEIGMAGWEGLAPDD